MKNYVGMILTFLLVSFAGWATKAVSRSAPLAESVARADSAYRSLPVMLAAYNLQTVYHENWNFVWIVRIEEIYLWLP
jgi:hypothetical protein